MSKFTPLLVLLVLVLAVMISARGGQIMYAIQSTNSSFSTVNITSDSPIVSSVLCTDDYSAGDAQVDLLGGTTKMVLCNATITDNNGGTDFNSTVPKGRFFGYSNKTVNSCTASSGSSNVDCYVNNTCSWLSPVSSISQYVECRFTVWFNAMNTTGNATSIWYGHINVTDLAGNIAGGNDSIEMADLLAVGVDGTMSFGSKVAGTNDSYVGNGGCGASCKDNVTNYGNIRFDILINGSSMACVGASGGTINVGYLHVNLTDAANYTQSYALTSTSSDSTGKFSDFDLMQSLTAGGTPVAPGRPTWWGIGIPYGVNGNCQSTIWFTAIVG
ncbi:MAG: hypothetical protein V1887_04730 [Candidatus Aenigmatarchaeota archaeon]